MFVKPNPNGSTPKTAKPLELNGIFSLYAHEMSNNNYLWVIRLLSASIKSALPHSSITAFQQSLHYFEAGLQNNPHRNMLHKLWRSNWIEQELDKNKNKKLK